MGRAIVEVITSSHVFVGRCDEMTGSDRRLLDILNSDSPLLVLADCRTRPLRDSTEPITLASTCFIPKARIVWARPLSAAVKVTKQQLVVNKETHPVLAFAPPFRVTGSAHILPGADPTAALARLVSAFLPITGAQATLDDDDSITWEADVILLNGRNMDVISAGASELASSRTGEQNTKKAKAA